MKKQIRPKEDTEMKKVLVVVLAVFLAVGLCSNAFAGWVKGYSRSNGTYVQPHYRSNPDGHKWNNVGPSTSGGYFNPYMRDNDRDGIPNYRDRDDNNNGIPDDSDVRQYRLR